MMRAQATANRKAVGMVDDVPRPLRRLRAEMEAAFAELGGQAMEWPDPHLVPDGERRAPADEEYSRVLDPEKYRILWLRAEAWARVLSARGWAERVEVEGADVEHWLGEQLVTPESMTVLRPARTGAAALRLARTETESSLRGILLGVGEPAVGLELLPNCGCDACDDGSAGLLSSLDTAILAVVEGAFELSWDGRELRLRTADHGSSGGATAFPAPFRIDGAPWADEWTPRPLIRLRPAPD